MLLSGPNTGGKTVLMKAVGLITLMAMSGLPVPADEDSTIGCFTGIYADIGDDQSIENALSTFSSHLDKIGKMLQKADENSLILIDEIGAATDPNRVRHCSSHLERLAVAKGIVTTAGAQGLRGTPCYVSLHAVRHEVPGAHLSLFGWHSRR